MCVCVLPDAGVCLPVSREAWTGTQGKGTTHGPSSTHTPVHITNNHNHNHNIWRKKKETKLKYKYRK